MTEPKVKQTVDVLEVVDICDRPIPNDNGGRNYQGSYFEEPDNKTEDDD